MGAELEGLCVGRVGLRLFACLFVCLIGWLVGCLFGWLVGWLLGWLAGLLMLPLVNWFVVVTLPESFLFGCHIP